MRTLRGVVRKAKNHFREESVFVKASTSKKNLGTRSNKLVKAKVPKRKLI
jgi:hypothetical protein